MTTPRSTLHIVKYLHREPTRGRSNSIVEIPDKNGSIQNYVRDYDANIGSGAYGEVYRLKMENDPTKTILAKKEKTKTEGQYRNGYNLRREAENWVKTKGFGGFAGDEKATDKPHILIMPDFANKTTVPLKAVRYDSATEFFKLMWLMLDKLDDFHNENQMVHYDLTENNILFDEKKRQIEFVDLGLARNIGETVHKAVTHRNSHSGESSGYFPPELGPRSNSIDKSAQTSHDVYIVGRTLSRLLKQYALDRNQKPLLFLPSIKEEFENISNAMQAPASIRISLFDAIRRMAILTRLCELLDKQDSLSENSDIIKKFAKNLLNVVDGNAEELRPLANHFSQKNQDAFLKLFGLTIVQELDENQIPSVRLRH